MDEVRYYSRDYSGSYQVHSIGTQVICTWVGCRPEGRRKGCGFLDPEVLYLSYLALEQS